MGRSSRHGSSTSCRNFVVFSDEPVGSREAGLPKYHQYWAVNAAVESTIEASGPDGDRRGGVVWHTQGSGKSIEMLPTRRRSMRARPRWATRRWCSSPIATISTTSCSARCSPRPASCPRRRGKREPGPRCARCSTGPPAASSSPRSRSSRRTRSGDPHPPLTDRRNVVVIADEASPLPVRLPRRVRPAPARRTAERHLPRLHRNADRNGRQVHPPGLRGLHRHLRPHPCRRRRRDGRGSSYESRLRGGQPSRGCQGCDRRRGRRRHRRQRDRRDRASQDPLGTSGGHRRRRRQTGRHRSGHRRALGGSAGEPARQGDGRLHEPTYLRRAVRTDRRPPP